MCAPRLMWGSLLFNMKRMESVEDLRRAAARDGALARAPGVVTRIDPVPVRVRAVEGTAIATTPTHVLVEWEKWGEYHVRWDEKWQVHRLDVKG